MMILSAEDFAPLLPSAPAALATQIEEMSPSAVALEVAGFRFQTADYLAQCISAGTADMTEVRTHALGSAAAVAICTAISARHARKAAAIAALKPPPAPEPVAQAITRGDREDARFAALSLLHDLTEMIGAERGDATLLNRAGFSPAASKELADLINMSRSF
jgi:hypothetical protein